MIAYRVELWCDGCKKHFATGIVHDDHKTLPNLGRNLITVSKESKWVEDGAAHFCVHCQRQKDVKVPA